MNKWRIIGAEAATGEERSIEINARDEAGAREAARMLGMLVASVERLAAPAGPVLDYRVPGLQNRPASVEVAHVAEPPAPDAPPDAPDYPAIVHGAAAAAGVAKALYALGTVALLLAAAGAVGAVLAGVNPDERVRVPFVLALALTAGAVGVSTIALAVGLQLVGAMALAVRDIARSTAQPDDAPPPPPPPPPDESRG